MEVFFNDTWRAYVHHPNDSRWTRESYAPLGMLSCVSDMWTLWNSCESVVDRTMMFIMREHVFPVWDDPACIEGSIGSAIVPQKDALAAFQDLACRALGEVLMRSSLDWADLNGVSIAPKNGFCVVKVWMRTCECDASRLALPSMLDPGSVRFQPCRNRIESARK